MTLTKVGTSDAPFGPIGAGGTFVVTFTPDTAFLEDDFLHIVLGAAQDVTGGNPGITLPAGWHGDEVNRYWTVGYTNHPYMFEAYHFVTAAEAGASPITLTVTVDSLGGVGAYMCPKGIAVRGGDSVASRSSTEWEDEQQSGTTSPQTNSHASQTGYPIGTAGSLLVYVATTGGGTTQTADSYAWTGATELSDDFHQNYFSTTRDGSISAAYSLRTDDTIPAVDVTRTFTPNGTSFKSNWLFYALDGTPVVYETPPPNFEPVSRRIHVRELPHQVSSPMFDDL